ncbi:MAG: polyphenol oxidase family protein [Synergistaceae bacterium]|nr:polyphenol oxidase family protein [Synergistaceae bacterium]
MLIPTSDFFTANFLFKGETIETFTIPHVMPSQVHGNKILVVDAKTPGEFFLPSRPEADGILLTVPGVQASLRFADCAPVMLWGTSPDWVMILHSGYKGTVLNISREGLELVSRIFGEASSREAFAWVGPCIGREYFRKSDDEWTLRGIESFHRDNFDVKGENIYFDLAGEIRCQLLDYGLRSRRVALSGIDTLKDERCYSYRKGDVHERMTLWARTGSRHCKTWR